MSIVTGQGGHGKSVLFGQIWYNVVRRYGVPAAIASFETQPKPHMRRQLRTLYTGLLEMHQSPQMQKEADEWINEYYLFFAHPEQTPTIEWWLDMAEIAVVRHGAKIIQADPWNRFEESRGQKESETDYIRRCLRTIHVFAQDMNVHVQIIAHPAKMGSERRNSAPMLEDISGSKHFENMTDSGVSIHRPDIGKNYPDGKRNTDVDFYHRKARFDALGYPCKLKLRLDLQSGRFVSIPSE